MYKLVAIDIDGTLLNPAGNINPTVRHAVQTALAKGCRIVLATGRRLRSARRVAQDLGLAAPLILYSGALIYDCQTEQAMLHLPLPRDLVEAAVEMLWQLKLNPTILQSPLQGERIFLGPTEYDNNFQQLYANRPNHTDLIERLPIQQLADVADPLVVTALGTNLDTYNQFKALQQAKSLLCNVFGYHLYFPNLEPMYSFDIVPANQNKGTALAWLVQYYGLKLSETMAIGDNSNDVDMLKMAGWGVAMGNALPEVQAASNFVVASNANDGVAEALERFVL